MWFRSKYFFKVESLDKWMSNKHFIQNPVSHKTFLHKYVANVAVCMAQDGHYRRKQKDKNSIFFIRIIKEQLLESYIIPIATGISVQLRAHFCVQVPSSFKTTVRSSCPTATFPSASGATSGSSCLPVGNSSLIEPRPSIYKGERNKCSLQV